MSRTCRWLSMVWVTACLSLSGADRLELEPATGGSWTRLHTSGTDEGVYRLEAAPDLRQWREIARTHDGIVQYPDPAATNWTQRFYRFSVHPRNPTNDWKNQIHFPQDAFLSLPGAFPEVLWVKFAVLLSDPARVVYQDSVKYPFHYDFARERLEPFRNLSPGQFDAVSLRTNNQQVLLGTVLYPPAPNQSEFGIQFVGLDPYPPQLVAAFFDLVQATVVAQPGTRALYVPTFEQSRVAQTNEAFFQARGIQIASPARWIAGDQCYSAGWALGRLRYIPGTEIDAAYADGRLHPSDILLTDAVPAEIPYLAGIITLQPSTPNSHVALLARNFAIPFVYLAKATVQTRVQDLVGRKIILRVTQRFDECEVRILDVEGMDGALEAEMLALKRAPELEIVPKAVFGALSAPTQELSPADIRYFGGKAANYGLLRRAIPDHCPEAIAFSFDLWDAFLEQTIPGGGTLRAEIARRLAGLNYPPDISALRQNLEIIRDLIRGADFTPTQRQAITNALAPFDPQRKIRFRSSTNMEDSEQFTGAGLYDSYSGCLLDDLDGDTTGPSRCDPGEANERGVFRAIKRVYASFYNDNAFLERLRHGVNETAVGMGVLVHHSFPDEFELANGVATMEIDATSSPQRFTMDMVSQKGAVPVTNPDNTAQPEVVVASRFSTQTYFTLRQRSSLVPLGGHVLDWEDDYAAFVALLDAVSLEFSRVHPDKQRYLLDFEFKKIAPDQRIIKQVRQLPMTATTNTVVPFFIGGTNEYEVFQGEFGDEFSNHYLKSLWAFSTDHSRLTSSNRAAGPFYRHLDWEYLEGGQVASYSGRLESLSNYRHTVDGEDIHEQWRLGSGAQARDYQLSSQGPLTVGAGEPPLLILEDFLLTLRVDYATPVPALDYSGVPMVATQQFVRLVPASSLGRPALRQDRTITQGRVSVHTSFYWPDPPTGIVAGYTAPLVSWEQTTITGLTSEPLVLQDAFSQTYRPGHHNFVEYFVFEPRLEPELSPAQRAELQAANIRLVHATTSGLGPAIQVLGFDGKFRVAE